VETAQGSAYTQFVFSPGGAKIAVIAGGALTKATIPLPGGETAVYNSSGLEFIRHTDWLGSSGLGTTWAHAVYSKESYAPFGETYNEAGTPDRSFTGQDQDTVTGAGATGVYDFLFRKYDPAAGRWISPDPLGWGAVNAADPQSLNRYAYVENQPVSYVDPDGLYPIPCPDASPSVSVDSNGNVTLHMQGCDQSSPTVSSWGDAVDFDPPLYFGVLGGGGGWYGGGGGGGGGAPNNGTPKQQKCAVETLKKNGVSLALDAAGFIPGESQVAATVQLGVSAASFTNSLMTGSGNNAAIGATSSIVGAQITGVGMAAKSMGVSWAKAVPWIGYGGWPRCRGLNYSTKDGWPRCLAFGHLGEHEPCQASSTLSRHPMAGGPPLTSR
jgi:RHS repeat-associated protein